MAVAADTLRTVFGAPADTATALSAGQRLALKYFLAAMVLFLAQTVFGLLAGLQFIYPEFLFGVLDFNVNRMVHLNAMIVWMLYGFIGSIYWLVEDEAGTELVGAKLANINFWVLTAAVAVVVIVYLVVQVGSGTRASIWLINEGREYIEAPRWADIGIVVCMGVFFYNVAATFMKGRWSGISGTLVLDLIALGRTLPGGHVLHHQPVGGPVLVVVGRASLGGGDLGGAGRLHHGLGPDEDPGREAAHRDHVALHRGGADVRLGHSRPGPPLFLDRHPGILAGARWVLLGARADPAGGHGSCTRSTTRAGTASGDNNHPALAWLIAHAFGNFLGAGVWGFMQTLPQINLYTHGTQWSSSHGHLAFFGAYTTIVIAFIYIALQKWRGDVWMSADLPDGGWKWKWALGLQCVGMLGMTMAMLIAGYEQAFVERAIGGSTWQAFFEGQTQPWFVQAMQWRMAFRRRDDGRAAAAVLGPADHRQERNAPREAGSRSGRGTARRSTLQ